MRYYDGCPDSEMQVFLDDQARAARQLAVQGMHATYFPLEGRWMVFDADHVAVTRFYSTKRAATDAALATLKGEDNAQT